MSVEEISSIINYKKEELERIMRQQAAALLQQPAHLLPSSWAFFKMMYFSEEQSEASWLAKAT